MFEAEDFEIGRVDVSVQIERVSSPSSVLLILISMIALIIARKLRK